jgi:hypothetical protein
MQTARGVLSPIAATGAVLATLFASGCSSMDVGSDVLWTARFEGGTLNEWATTPGASTLGVQAALPNTVDVSMLHAHEGQYSGRLFIDTSSAGVQQSAGLNRKVGLPTEAYYSAWYYLPQTETVGSFWVIFKFRRRTVVDDPSTEGELFDVDLINDAAGEMTLQLYDHRTEAAVPLQVSGLVVPVGVWFQIEGYYRNAADSTGALTVWLNGVSIVDLRGETTSPTRVEWDVTSVGENLTPSATTLFVDDCAVSRRRVGPTGIIAE